MVASCAAQAWQIAQPEIRRGRARHSARAPARAAQRSTLGRISRGRRYIDATTAAPADYAALRHVESSCHWASRQCRPHALAHHALADAQRVATWHATDHADAAGPGVPPCADATVLVCGRHRREVRHGVGDVTESAAMPARSGVHEVRRQRDRAPPAARAPAIARRPRRLRRPPHHRRWQISLPSPSRPSRAPALHQPPGCPLASRAPPSRGQRLRRRRRLPPPLRPRR